MSGLHQCVDEAVIARSGLLLSLYQSGCPAILPTFVDLHIFQAWSSGPSAWPPAWPSLSDTLQQGKSSNKSRGKRQTQRIDRDPLLEELAAIFVVRLCSLSLHICQSAHHVRSRFLHSLLKSTKRMCCRPG